jgi:hypothetical protein
MNECTAEGEAAIEKGGNGLKRKKKRIFPPEKEFIATRERDYSRSVPNPGGGAAILLAAHL